MKQQILFLILNFSSESKPLDSRFFYSKMNDTDEINDEKLKVFQRKLTYSIYEIQEDEYKNYKAGKSFNVILSNNNGYYVARSLQEAINGKDFLYDRVKPIVIRTNRIKEMIQDKFNTDLKEPDLFI